ncbi:MAG TPA: hypothetical protein VGX68_18705 [Thermoanaerobaculia bacterium]|jgi:hypothetical protein|nr:hypothetical protein [Thermoanaerobaculia bacterium]
MTEPPNEVTSGNRPFWRDPAYVTALAGLIAAMIPLTAAVNGYFALELEKAKFTSELQLKYVDRALDTSKDPSYRESFMRFLIEATVPSDLLHKWAKSQLLNASEIGRVRAELAKLNTSLRVSSDQLAQERKRRSQNEAAASRRELDLRGLVSRALTEKERLEAKLRAAELKAGYTPLKQEEKNLKPKVFRAEIGFESFSRGFSRLFPGEIRISGENFGQRIGHVYEGTSRTAPLEILDWSDTEIKARTTHLPRPDWQGYPPRWISIVTADSRVIELVELSPEDRGI